MTQTTNCFDDFMRHETGEVISFDLAKKIYKAADDLAGGRLSKVIPLYSYHRDPKYTEIWPRVLYYSQPSNYDVYGYNENMEKWEYEDLAISIIDDFGNAVPFDILNYSQEELRGYLAPDYDPTTPLGQPYKYVLYTPEPH